MSNLFTVYYCLFDIIRYICIINVTMIIKQTKNKRL